MADSRAIRVVSSGSSQVRGLRPGTDRPAAARSSALALGLLLSASALGGMGCKKPDPGATSEKPGATSTPTASPVAATFTKVEERLVPQRLEVTGTLDPDERAEVASQTLGTVLAVNIDIGTRVKKGDVLVELDGREASLRLQSANATAASQKARLGLEAGAKFDPDAVADVRAAKDARDLASAEFDRAKALFDSGAISKAQFDQAKSAKERADAGYETARNGAQQAWSGLVATQAQAGLSGKALDDTKIRAPFDGVVIEKRISPGEFASAGRVVLVLIRDTPLRFKFDVPESAVSTVTLGKPVELEVAAYPGRVFRGQVKHIGGSIKVQTRTLPVEAEVPNEELVLRSGFFAKAYLELGGEPQKALFVPRAALRPLGSGHRLFVKKEGRVLERLVTTGAIDGESVEVRGQLAAGEEIALDHLDELFDGAPLAP